MLYEQVFTINKFMDITVAICTYNGEARLPEVLDRLSGQSTDNSLSWEIIVVDNNSCDCTNHVVKNYQTLPGLGKRLRYVFEHRQGLAYARRRAVQEAESELIAFLDDDNLPAVDWLQSAYHFSQQHPEAGAYGSKIIGKYEVSPPPDFNRIACFLAIIDRGVHPFRYDELTQWLFPAGAGFVVRKKAWQSAVIDRPALAGVSGDCLDSKGEDIETFSYLRKGGWQIWHNPEMCIEHVINKERLTEAYLIRLFRGVGLSRYHTRIIRFKTWQRFPAITAYAFIDAVRLLTYKIKGGRNCSSVVEQCELTLLRYSLVSPVYYFVTVARRKLLSRQSFVHHSHKSARVI